MVKVSHTDFVHTGPGTLAGRYLRSFWQPIYHAKDLAPGRARPIRAMSEDFTLYRGETGKPHLVDLRCAHRGSQLSVGWVEGDDIRCLYHGWKYDAEGQCVEQPAEPEPFCHKVEIGSYPVREYLGLIFAYFGENEPPEFPHYPDFEDTDGRLEHASYTRRCNYYQNLENFLDATHVGFVHRDQPGGFDGRIDSPLLHVEESQWGASCRVERPSGHIGLTQFGMPNIMHLMGIPIAPQIVGHREFLAWWVPIDDESHTYFGVVAVRLSGEDRKRYEEIRDARHARETVPNQDLAEAILAGKIDRADVEEGTTDFIRLVDDLAQVGQGRIYDRDRDRLGRGDVGVIMIRKLWARELQAFAEGGQLKNWAYSPELELAKP